MIIITTITTTITIIKIIIITIIIIIRPGPLCCPEIYRDVPGKFHDDDDD
jgi:hypothetical protein